MQRPPRRTVAVLAVIAVSSGACGGRTRIDRPVSPPLSAAGRSVRPTATAADAAAAATSPAPSAPPAFLPAPDAALPSGPAAAAAALVRTTGALHDSIRPWRERGYHSAPPRAVVLQALFQQRLYRALAKDPALWSATRSGLPARLRHEAQPDVNAVADLRAIVSPVGHPVAFRTGPPTPPDDLVRFYHEAEARFGVPWNVLAAVNFVESKFDRARNPSSAGAQGPMQFLPSTWAAYGMGGDIHDPHDAVMAAANYLHANGAPRDLSRALFAYNRSTAYVDAILAYANRMRADPDAFGEYYDWQVFVATPSGDRRLTGPGA